MDNVQNCDSYINIPSAQTYRYYLDGLVSDIETRISQAKKECCNNDSKIHAGKYESFSRLYTRCLP
jgi:hypothetical protein